MARPAPGLSKELLEWLASVFPDRCPNPDDTENEIRMKIGEQRVIRKLRAEYNSQAHNALGEDP